MKKVLSLLLVMIIASAFLLVSCAELAQGNPGSYEGNQGSVNGQKQIPVYQGMTITSMQSTSELLYSDNRDEKHQNPSELDNAPTRAFGYGEYNVA